MLIFGTLFAIYLIPTLFKDFSNLEDIDSLSRKKQVAEEDFAPNEAVKEKNSVLEALHEVQRKAEEKVCALCVCSHRDYYLVPGGIGAP